MPMAHELIKEKPYAYFVNVSVYFLETYDKFSHYCFDNASSK